MLFNLTAFLLKKFYYEKIINLLGNDVDAYAFPSLPICP